MSATQPEGGHHSVRGGRPYLHALGALVLVLAATAHALEGDFVWDDRPLVLEQPQVRELGSLSSYFLRPFWDVTPEQPDAVPFYRPLTTLSYAVDYSLHGPNAAGFHLTNLLLHALNVALLFAYARRLGAGAFAAGVAAVAWGVSPRLAECFAWISGRTDVLATTFVLAALLVADGRSAARGLAAGVLLALGALSKEVALAAGVGLALQGLAERGHGALAGGRSGARFAAALAPLAVGATVALGLRAAAATPLAGGAMELGVAGRALTILEAVGRAAGMLAWPWSANAQAGVLGVRDARFVALGVVALVAALAVAVRARPSPPSLAAWGTLVTAVGLTAHVVPLAGLTVSADRFAYLPLAMVAAVAAGAAEGLAPGRRRATALAGSVLAASLGVACFARVGQWRSEASLWAVTRGHAHPANGRPWQELAGLYFSVGQTDEALVAYERSVEAWRRHPEPRLAWQAQSGAARALLLLGRTDEAAARLDALVGAAPAGALALERARLHLARGDFDAAERSAAALAERRPTHGPTVALLQSARHAREVARSLGEAPRGAPWVAARRATLAAASGRLVEALDGYRAVLRAGHAAPAETVEAVVFLVRYGEPDEGEVLLEKWGSLLEDPEGLRAEVLDRASRRRELAAVLEAG